MAKLSIPRSTHLWRFFIKPTPTYCGTQPFGGNSKDFVATYNERTFTCGLCRKARDLEQVTKRLKS